jgi:hypothetical protein
MANPSTIVSKSFLPRRLQIPFYVYGVSAEELEK